MQHRALMTLGAFPALVTGCYMAHLAPSQAASMVTFAPDNGTPAMNRWILPAKRPVILAQGHDAFPPLGFDPSHPEKTNQKPERAPIWPVSPALTGTSKPAGKVMPEPAKPAKIEPMKLMQPPGPAPVPAAVQPARPRTTGNTDMRPAYPAPQPPAGIYPAPIMPPAAMPYGYPQPPGFDWGDPSRNPWAPGTRNSWVRSGNNSWNKAGRNSWSRTGRNNINTNRQNPWAAPNRDGNRSQNYRSRVPYYGQRQPVFAPRFGNPWDIDAGRAANGAYAPQFAPLYRPRETKDKTQPTSRNGTAGYPEPNWFAPAPWYGGPARRR